MYDIHAHTHTIITHHTHTCAAIIRAKANSMGTVQKQLVEEKDLPSEQKDWFEGGVTIQHIHNHNLFVTLIAC